MYIQDHQKLGYGSMNGISMVATSPGSFSFQINILLIVTFSVRQDSPVGVNPVDITGYQVLWCDIILYVNFNFNAPFARHQPD